MDGRQRVGRDGVVADLVRALSEPRSRCILVGEAGLGKTTVVDGVVEKFERTTLQIRCAAIEVESSLGLSVAADIAAAVLELQPSMPADDATALRALVDPVPDQSPVDPRTVAVALGRTLAGIAPNQPLLLVLDDLHWVDAQSAAILSLALRRAMDADIRVLAATRGPIPLPLPDAIVIPLSALDRVPLTEIVNRRVDMRLSPQVTHALLAASGGNPLLALEIARSLPVEATEADVQLPGTLADRVATRLQTLPASCRDALLDVAVRGSCRWDELRDSDRISPAVDAGVIKVDRGRLSFDHPLFLRGMLDTAPPDSIAQAHVRAANATSDPLVRAWHLAQAPLTPDEDRASDLENAAEQFLRRGDLVTAEQVALAAVDASPATTASDVLWRRSYLVARAVQPMSAVSPQLIEKLRSLAHNADEKALTELAGASTVSEELALLRPDTAELSMPVRLWMASQLLTVTLLTGDHRVGVDAVAPLVPNVAPPGAETAWAEVVAAMQLMNRVSGLAVDMAAVDSATAIASRDSGPADVELGQGPRAIRGLIAMYDDDQALSVEKLARARLSIKAVVTLRLK